MSNDCKALFALDSAMHKCRCPRPGTYNPDSHKQGTVLKSSIRQQMCSTSTSTTESCWESCLGLGAYVEVEKQEWSTVRYGYEIVPGARYTSLGQTVFGLLQHS